MKQLVLTLVLFMLAFLAILTTFGAGFGARELLVWFLALCVAVFFAVRSHLRKTKAR
ncbi:hypothetical protein [Streptomyces sp. NPDC057694]|uniref:hypothetical protein n=1 Tax=Streptomyces sp. NPDC057694 TaxID=3346216 RepID=UPI0036BD8548